MPQGLSPTGDSNSKNGRETHSYPVLCRSESPPLSSFATLRSRNLFAVYGSTQPSIGNYSDNQIDKSPKGSIDEKIRPLVDLINGHPEYVTLSSCSGRISLFDPTGDANNQHRFYGGALERQLDDKTDSNNSDTRENGLHYDYSNSNTGTPYTSDVVEDSVRDDDDMTQYEKSTNVSGKGRGTWMFVTHDILPDLGPKIIHALRNHGRTHTQNNIASSPTTGTSDPTIVTLKHEPPLLHIAACSLSSGKKLLRIFKSICAMRESGLVVTDQRVTVEVRTTGTLLCVPVMIVDDHSTDAVKYPSFLPGEDYLMAFADVANERMKRDEILLNKMYCAIENELFSDCVAAGSVGTYLHDSCDKEFNYEITMQGLPPLNLWKSAAVVIPSLVISQDTTSSAAIDVDLLAFGGQGIGPSVLNCDGSNTTCRRWDRIFRLKRRDGVWSDNWDIVKTDSSIKEESRVIERDDLDSKGTHMVTDAGKFHVREIPSFGGREGHAACVLPPIGLSTPRQPTTSTNSVIAIFGGRTSGPMSPSNDFFLFSPYQCNTGVSTDDDFGGILASPIDVRGAPPEPRFGHSMNALHYSDHCDDNFDHREALAVVAGGCGICGDTSDENINNPDSRSSPISFSSVYILSRLTDRDSGLSHFTWERLHDMRVPRFYHSATLVPMKCHNKILIVIFGGVLSQPDDPFLTHDQTENICPSPTHEILRYGSRTLLDITECEFPKLIGSASVALTLPTWGNEEEPSKASILIVGGVEPMISDQTSSENDIIKIVECQFDGNATIIHPLKTNIAFVQNSWSDGHAPSIDFGVCVHHSLVALPFSVLAKLEGDVVASAVVVGGGVPSFSFGQSYAKSHYVNVKRMYTTPTPNPKRKPPVNPPVVSSNNPEVRHIPSTGRIEADVIYVSSSDAKKVKVELESMGCLDRRYKMIKIVDGRNLIALPITDTCRSILEKSELGNAGVRQPRHSFESSIVGIGREVVPHSSSYLGRIKQRH